ncbi:phosphomevalonate kinase [Actinosynnema sp. NPDC020468]|uniref:phosphomevalonate kinase n=1 Tax=Actinosynnema sp. NPDC020468 TaxID=3154488 RepID=UPI00340AFF2D
MTPPVVRRAPGKLFVAGEYAVLHPGSPAILVAVDRGITVTATPAAEDVVIASDLAAGEVRLSRDGAGLAAGDGPPPVVSAIEAVDALLTEWGLPLPRIRLEIASDLHEDGVKFGLGSSGAVTVATIEAVLAHCGVTLPVAERFRLALLATARLDPRASGGDLAASTWGGWISYRAPDRTAVLSLARRVGVGEALRAPWPGFEVRPLPAPRGLALEVGWTRRPASTARLVAGDAVRNWRAGPAYREFVRRSGECVTAAVEALERGDDPALLAEIRGARRLLAEADDTAGLGIFTDGLTALCDAAEAVGGAGKPSGAGGGDCGIALVEPAATTVDRLREHWRAAGISPLPVRIPAPERTTTVISDRKDDHVRLALEHHRPHDRNEFDDIAFVHHALGGVDRADVSLDTRFADLHWRVPLYINAMTGGSAKTGDINRDLAIAARETGVPIASGSMSAYFKDPATAGTFAVLREQNPDGFVMANVNANATVEQAKRAVDLLRADALQIHLNAVQETVMPEGDRSFSAWAPRIEEIAAGLDVPVIVKEVGFGLSRDTVVTLVKLGVRVADVGGRGGTDFARIENSRREHREYAYLDGWGQSAPACLLDARDVGLPLLASGGVRHPLDVVRGLALGASAVGASGTFLKTVLDGGPDALIARISGWLDQIAALMTALGARTPAELAGCDVLIRGALREFCADRGVDLRGSATRTRATAPEQETLHDR